MNKPLKIGVGAGFADDRIAPAVELAESGEIDYLVFECLAERTTARENLSRQKDPRLGYSPRLAERMTAVLPGCRQYGTRIVTNMGAANPLAGARLVRKVARELGLGDVPCAAVEGDDVSAAILEMPGLPLLENGEPLESISTRMVSANAYLGADVVRDALRTGAEVVITGRVSDPSLFLAPAMHHFGWNCDDLDKLAAGSLAGHLLECGVQVSGGCFADPGRKSVTDLARVGAPIGEILADGSVTITKLEGSGGRVDVATCSEQLIYEVHNPAEYITPDCVLDLTEVTLEETSPNRVLARGARARPRTPTYKVTVGYFDGYIGVGEVSYAGINAVARAKLAAEVVQERLRLLGYRYSEIRVDLIGMSSLHGMEAGRPEPYEVRLRIAARTEDRTAAHAVGVETRALHVSGPAGGGGGADPVVRQVLAVASVLVPRGIVKPRITVERND